MHAYGVQGPKGLGRCWGGGATHHVDKSRQEHEGDGEHPHQSAVHLGPHDLPGEGLQRGRKELSQGQREGERERDETEFNGLHIPPQRRQ